uniref:Homeobox domain-containing protein n=1 Tax=Meloidogyne floridensis TaxID=298350 RepID=A0A915NFF9_9BILA
MSARFLIDDLLTKSLPPENYLEEDNNKKKNKFFEEFTQLLPPTIFGQTVLGQILPKIINEKILKEDMIVEEHPNSERKGGQSEEEFSGNKLKSEQQANNNLEHLLSFNKSLSHNQPINEQKKHENNGIAPAWFLPFQQQQTNNSLPNNCLKQFPQLTLPPQFITNINKSNGHFIPFFGHLINNHFNQNNHKQENNLNLHHKRKGGQIRFSNEQTDILERTFDAKMYLSTQERKRISRALKLSERQVKTWFQNRRAKYRRQAPADSDCVQPSDDSLINTQQQQYRNDLFNIKSQHFLENVD